MTTSTDCEEYETVDVTDTSTHSAHSTLFHLSYRVVVGRSKYEREVCAAFWIARRALLATDKARKLSLIHI